MFFWELDFFDFQLLFHFFFIFWLSVLLKRGNCFVLFCLFSIIVCVPLNLC